MKQALGAAECVNQIVSTLYRSPRTSGFERSPAVGGHFGLEDVDEALARAHL
jgi:hypothetical protein